MANETKQPGQIVTIERHILEEQSSFPGATGTLTALLYDIALAGKIIASKTNRAGLAEILGRTGETNIQGEQVQKLDQFADATFFNMNDHTGRVAVMASEEHEDFLPIPKKYPAGKYVLLFDPLDGSSNIDYNICLGTIFCIYHKITDGRGSLADCLQKGRQVVAAGYLLYGTSTMLVYSTGRGVNGFTLDPSVGEFLLSHPSMRIPEPPPILQPQPGQRKILEQGHAGLYRLAAGASAGLARPVGAARRFTGGGFPPQFTGRRRVRLSGRQPRPRQNARQTALIV